MDQQYKILQKQLQENGFTKEDLSRVEKAWDFAKLAHTDQKRVSGEDFILHPLRTAGYLAEWKMDPTSIVVALLHDTIDWGGATHKDLIDEFGSEVADLVEAVSRVSKAKIRGRENELFVENFRKMILAMAKDLRVVILRMAERLDNMHSLDALSEERQKKIAKETLELFAPLAERLGMGTIKSELEDLAFPYVSSENYKRVHEIVKQYHKHAEEQIETIRRTLLKDFASQNIHAHIYGRKKHIYSLWKKLEKPEIDWDIDKIHDVVALRIIVQSVEDCYTSLGILYRNFKPVPYLRFSDFIAHPKPNGYQSIHTKVFGPGGRIVEFQIRTHEMHQQAEYGVAAHWAYSQAKSKGVSDAKLESGQVRADEKQLHWVKQLASWQDELASSEEFLKAVKFDALNDRIFVFSPKGDVFDLPVNATPVDFAFAVHTGLGSFIQGARVQNRTVPLDYKLKNGDVVEIIKSKQPRMPNHDWLNFVVTTYARREINKRLRGKAAPYNVDKD